MGGFGVARSPADTDKQDPDRLHILGIAIDSQLALNSSAIAFILYYT